MSSAETDTEAAAPSDERREALLAGLTEALGDAVAAHHLDAGRDLVVRVDTAAWQEAARAARDRLGFAYFSFLSAIDWLPSPYGRGMDSEVDNELSGAVPKDPGEMALGVTGGSSRFQVLARLHSLRRGVGLTLKADVPEETMAVDSWSGLYAGANWHERECWEMFGITFVGHPGLRHLYLPGDFEGHPLRKDFPLLARHVKPWPGIVDVEAMPGVADEGEAEGGDQ
ncbi:MAG: NADH-quinone oxidoreductase subunit C [Acidimicrobiales bacterium]